jgi:hypothetical protein
MYAVLLKVFCILQIELARRCSASPNCVIAVFLTCCAVVAVGWAFTALAAAWALVAICQARSGSARRALLFAALVALVDASEMQWQSRRSDGETDAGRRSQTASWIVNAAVGAFAILILKEERSKAYVRIDEAGVVEEAL